MSYIEDNRSIESFTENMTASKRELFEMSYKQFNLFTNQAYSKDSETVLSDVAKYCKEQRENDKFYTLMNQYAQWLQEDHPELKSVRGSKYKYVTYFKKKSPHSTGIYVGIIVQYFEDIHKMETSRSILKKRISLKEQVKDDPEPFTKEEVRLFCDNARADRKLLYMVLKDSGMRIGETVQLRKSDIDATKDPVQINIKAKYTKEKKSHITFVTNETKPMLLNRLAKLQDDELVFGKSENVYSAKNIEESVFNYLREKLGLTERYSHSNRHKKTLHSFRSYTATQASKALDDNWSHALLGHKQYLQQYIRNHDEYPQFYKRTEPHLMIYEQVEVVDNTHEIDTMKKNIAYLMNCQDKMSRIEAEIRELEKQKALLTL